MIQSFWRDEAFSYVLAKKSLFDITYFTAHDFNPPLYYYLLHIWMKIFGHSEIALRSLSLLFFVGSVYVAYLFIKDFVTKNPQRIFIYTLFFALNPSLLYFAFEARMYSMAAFLSIVSYYFFLKKDIKKYMIISLFGLFTHYYFIFVLLSQILYSLITKDPFIKNNVKRLWPLIIFVPWIVYCFPTLISKTGSFWMEKMKLYDISVLPATLFTSHEMYYNYYTVGLPLLAFMFSIFIIISFIFLHKKPTYLFLFCWTFPFYFLIALISVIKPIFVARYLLFATAGFSLFIVYGIEHMKQRGRIALMVLLFLVTIHYIGNESMFKRKGDIRSTLKEINSLAKPTDIISAVDGGNYFVISYYLGEQRAYVYGQKNAIPYYVGLALIPDNKISEVVPSYPKKMFLLKGDYEYDIISE
jgi:uncharacterized membrane protein